jgi:hypothetical protein
MQQLRHLQLSQFIVALPALLAALRSLQQLQHLTYHLPMTRGHCKAQTCSSTRHSRRLLSSRICVSLPTGPVFWPGCKNAEF